MLEKCYDLIRFLFIIAIAIAVLGLIGFMIKFLIFFLFILPMTG